ncbi:MAG: glycosyltransferase [Bacteroidia bacterium]|nr:glycosyltransferase [Bacteroidia bacterium]MCZ2249605.1 glycosyltransferase [Bacteroidia bacterium]
MSKMLPKISVITPSYNQGEFIEETILSVINQDYPNIEYIVLDAASNDNTVNIIKKYENKISYWISEKDKGQADAVNKGFARATGDILCWLNSDDYYLPGTLKFVAENLDINKAQILFGEVDHIFDKTKEIVHSNVKNKLEHYNLKYYDYIIQPGSFWTRKVWENTGSLKHDMHFAFDWDWFIRAEMLGTEFKYVSRVMSIYRIHDAHKTNNGGEKRLKEIDYILKHYSGNRVLEAYKLIRTERSNIESIINKAVKSGLTRFDMKLLRLRYAQKLLLVPDRVLRQLYELA